eukprot:Skav233145  [mRNA]  locus=scaffold1669:42094:66418:+ [translate_table: standard]
MQFLERSWYCVCAICAAPRKKDHIRIVSTTARDSEEVLEDLLDEAEALPMTATGADGEKTTTLLVCPFVEEWKSFGAFRDFYEIDLEGGSTFLEEFDMKILGCGYGMTPIVAFHPEYLKYGFSVTAGDRIAVANFDGTSSSATVLDEEGGVHPDDGEELLDVRFDNGEEFLIRYSKDGNVDWYFDSVCQVLAMIDRLFESMLLFKSGKSHQSATCTPTRLHGLDGTAYLICRGFCRCEFEAMQGAEILRKSIMVSRRYEHELAALGMSPMFRKIKATRETWRRLAAACDEAQNAIQALNWSSSSALMPSMMVRYAGAKVFAALQATEEGIHDEGAEAWGMLGATWETQL